ncbi:hypothetical protein AAXE64_27620 [Priestia megaterium]
MFENLQYRSQGMRKIASVYDEQAISNRKQEEKALSFSSLSPMESETIFSKMASDVSELRKDSMEKRANTASNPFELFSQTKQYISKKLGISGESAHDFASTVVQRAEDLQQTHGGELPNVITGIIDNMDRNVIQQQIGALPMRRLTQKQVEEMIEHRLLKEAGMDSYRAEYYKRMIVQQARNFLTTYRNKELADIANAVFDVLIENHDFDLVKNFSTSDRLKNELTHFLNQ